MVIFYNFLIFSQIKVERIVADEESVIAQEINKILYVKDCYAQSTYYYMLMVSYNHYL